MYFSFIFNENIKWKNKNHPLNKMSKKYFKLMKVTYCLLPQKFKLRMNH